MKARGKMKSPESYRQTDSTRLPYLRQWENPLARHGGRPHTLWLF